MSQNVKRKTLACLLGIIILTVLVAGALPGLELKLGEPLPGQPAGTMGVPPDEFSPLPAISVNSFWKAVLGILLLAGLLYNFYRLLRRQVELEGCCPVAFLHGPPDPRPGRLDLHLVPHPRHAASGPAGDDPADARAGGGPTPGEPCRPA